MVYSKQCFDVEQEYSRNTNLKRDDIKMLHAWVDTQSQYPAISNLELFLFLHSCYYSTEKAKKAIDSYYKMRSNWPEVFKNRNPSVNPLRPHLPITVQWPLNQSTNEGYKILFAKILNSDCNLYDVNEQIKLFFVVSDLWLTNVENSDGLVIILDSVGLTWGHVPKFGINPARKLLTYVQEAFPVRLKGVHFINASPILEKILVVARVFMKKELYDMTHVHSNFETLYKYVPKSCLPKDYGGDDVTIKELHEDMMETLINNCELFVEENIRSAGNQQNIGQV